MTALNSLRDDVKALLEDAGIRAVEYAETKIVPPIAVVVPDEPYVVAAEQGRNTFGEYNVGIRVLLIGGKGTSKVSANEIDSMIEKAVIALDDFDVTQVSAPGQVDLNGSNHFGSIISIEATIRFTRED